MLILRHYCGMRERAFFKDLREHAKRYRLENDIGLKEMAEKIGLTTSPYRDFEKGKGLPREESLERLISLVLPRSEWGIHADRLRNIADILSQPEFPEEVKREQYIGFLRSNFTDEKIAGIIHGDTPKASTR